MFRLTDKVKVNTLTPPVTKEYEKIWFEGDKMENDVPVGGESAALLKATIDFFKSIAPPPEDGKAPSDGIRELLAHVTNSYDLKIRGKIRIAAEKEVEGPGKNLERQIRAFMEEKARRGKPVTYEAARERMLLLYEQD